MHALVVADGEAPDRAALDATWPDWRDGVELIVAADGGAIGARNAGLVPDLVVGDADSLGESGLAELAAAGIAVERSPVDKDESDTELAVLACVARGASSITIVGGLGGRLDHELANIWLLALPALGPRPVRILDGRTRVRLIRAPGEDGGPVRRELAGRPGDLVTLLPLGEHVEGITTENLRYPLRDEPLRVGPARGLSNVRLTEMAAVTVRRGLLLVVESPATLSHMNDQQQAIIAAEQAPRVIPQVGQVAPEVALPDETRMVHRLAEQHGRWTILYFYPEDDTSGCTTEACQFRDIHEAMVASDADVWGVSPDGAASHERFMTKYGLPFTLLSDEDNDVSTRYGAWTLKNNYGRTSMGIVRSSFLIDPDGRIAHVWPKVKADGHAADVMAVLAAARKLRRG